MLNSINQTCILCCVVSQCTHIMLDSNTLLPVETHPHVILIRNHFWPVILFCVPITQVKWLHALYLFVAIKSTLKKIFQLNGQRCTLQMTGVKSRNLKTKKWQSKCVEYIRPTVWRYEAAALVLVSSLRGAVAKKACVEPLMFAVAEGEACGATLLRCSHPCRHLLPNQADRDVLRINPASESLTRVFRVRTLFPRRGASAAGPLCLYWWCWCETIASADKRRQRLKARWAPLTQCLMSNTLRSEVFNLSEGRPSVRDEGQVRSFCAHRLGMKQTTE